MNDAGSGYRYKKIDQMRNCVLKAPIGYVDVIQTAFIYISCS